MPPVPALTMSSPHGLGATPRGPFSARSMPGSRPGTGMMAQAGALQLSARHVVAPQVGVATMVSDLGKMKKPWDKTPSEMLAAVHNVHQAEDTPRPYVVGRARAAQQLDIAFSTRDERAKLRRLEQALEAPALRYDDAMTPRMAKAAKTAEVLSRRLLAEDKLSLVKQKMQEAKAAGVKVDQAALEEEANQFIEEEKAAATRIQSLYRGKKDRKVTQTKIQAKRDQAEKERREEEDAATKIQSRFRGKAARKEMEKK
mmetsp:Transcript_89238/g.158222  ORF Transcript_89238/g.158222 Transcript_89238/m.158222 type:complete len:257 (+) Transcript_89238:68-838(+)